MGRTSFTLALLKPEIASGVYKFASAPEKTPSFTNSSLSRQATSRANNDNEDPSNSNDPSQESEAETETETETETAPQVRLRSSIAGVTAVEAALLYPDGQILSNLFTRIAKAGFTIENRRMVQLTKAQARSLFGFEVERLKDKKKFRAFLDHVTSGLSMALLLAYPESTSPSDAIAKWKALVGRENPAVARQEALSASLPHDEWPLHALCGLNSIQNGIQSSANLDCFHRERAFLFPSEGGGETQRLERAVVVLLPIFLTAFPEGKALLLTKLNSGGVFVSKVNETYRFPSLKELSLLAKELHPVTNEQHRAEFLERLQLAVGIDVDIEAGGDNINSGCCLLEVEALDLSTKVRSILGPASIESARIYFPESVRAQIPKSLTSLKHVRTFENDTTCLESGVFVSFEPKTVYILTNHTPKNDEIEHTFAIIKPGTASDPFAVSEIQSAIRAFGFSIEKERRLLLTRAQAATFYGEHRGKVFFERLLAFMTSGEIVAMRLARKNAILTWRALMGPTNALKARETHPWTLRARFGVDSMRNATHGSDAKSSARREVKFFFGGGLQAFADGGEALEKASHGTKAITQRALPSPYPPELTPEKVLTLALDEMLGFEVVSQVDACAWLGNWLVEYAQRQQLKQHTERDNDSSSLPSDHSQPTIFKHGTGTLVKKNLQNVAPEDSAELLFGSNCTLMVVSYETDAPTPLRAAVGEALCSLATASKFLFLDVAATFREETNMDDAIRLLVSHIKASGKRKFVLHDFDLKSAALSRAFHAQLAWRINFAVTIRSNSNSTDPTVPQTTEFETALDPMVPHVYYNLQQSLNDFAQNLSFQMFFAGFFNPMIVVVHDPKKLVASSQWSTTAQHFGLQVLTFEDLIQARIAKERSANGIFTQLRRTRATILRELLLALFSDVVNNFQPKTTSDDEKMGCAQKFLVCGFPFESEALPTEFEQHVGPMYRLLNVQSQQISTKPMKDDAVNAGSAWVSHARKRGVVTDLWIDPANGYSTSTGGGLLRASCGLSFGPIVGFCVGGRSDKHTQQIKRAAQAQGFIWMDVGHLAEETAKRPEQGDIVAILKRMLLRANADREKVLLYGFPLSKESLLAFIERVCVPRFVVIASTLAKSSSSSSSELQAFVGVLDEFPQIVQLDITHASETNNSRATSLARLQSVLFGKRASFLVGDTADLKRENVQTAIAANGYCVLDLRKRQQEDPSDVDTSTSDGVVVNIHVQSIASQIQATAGPRCLVIGAPEHLNFFQALETTIGSAVDKIVLLKHVKRQAPPRASKRDEEGEDYYSDDEEELERQQQLKARADLPKHLDELLQVYGSTKSSGGATGATSQIVVSRVTFLEVVDKVYEQIRSQLLPMVLGVVGNPHTFYASALSFCAKRHAIALLPSTWWRTSEKGDSSMSLDQKMTKLQRFVADTPFAIYFVDGFPRTASDAAAPYVAQKLWALERTVAAMQALVHFTASMDVLVERKPEGVTRNMLEDAQDELDAQTSELLACFASSSTSMSTSVSSQKRQKVLSVPCERELVDTQEKLKEVLLHAGVLR